MPELPEVETTARALSPLLVGRSIVGVEVGWERTLGEMPPVAFADAVLGRSFSAAERRGKFVLLRLDDGAALLIHRRMTGNLLVLPTGTPPDPYTRVSLALSDGQELRFKDVRKFGRILYFADDETLEAYLALKAGPEPLDDLTPERLKTLLAGRRGRLKALLLDQRFLAGVGNIYADESLWRARLHPERIASTLTDDEIARLAEAIPAVLSAAIERRGTTLRDYTGPEGERGTNQDFLNVYGRDGLPCPRCETPVVKYWLGQRGTHYCPTCQVAPTPG